jgi:hypothetical protein
MAFEAHSAELARKLHKSEAHAQELEKKVKSYKDDNARLMRIVAEQREFSSALIGKALGSAVFEDAMLDLVKSANASQGHEVYKALRGWIPGPYRFECQKSYYRPKAYEQYVYKLQKLKKAELETLLPETYKALLNRPLSVSGLKKVPEMMSSRAMASEEPGEDVFNEYEVCPESPVDGKNYIEYCANPENLGYSIIEDEAGVRIGASDTRNLLQLSEALAAPILVPELEQEAEQPTQQNTEELRDDEQQEEEDHLEEALDGERSGELWTNHERERKSNGSVGAEALLLSRAHLDFVEVSSPRRRNRRPGKGNMAAVFPTLIAMDSITTICRPIAALPYWHPREES